NTDSSGKTLKIQSMVLLQQYFSGQHTLIRVKIRPSLNNSMGFTVDYARMTNRFLTDSDVFRHIAQPLLCFVHDVGFSLADS
ncbi:hypothetical protein ABTN32_20515, partial [Acinetobacter baumannii]